MAIFHVCAKKDVPRVVEAVQATHLVTMLDPGEKLWRPDRIAANKHLNLRFADTDVHTEVHAPTLRHAESILWFGDQLQEGDVCVVHCFAGISRSTASALALWTQFNGLDRLEEGMKWLREHRPIACPNGLLAKHFDELLGAGGAFHDACESIAFDHILKLTQ